MKPIARIAALALIVSTSAWAQSSNLSPPPPPPGQDEETAPPPPPAQVPPPPEDRAGAAQAPAPGYAQPPAGQQTAQPPPAAPAPPQGYAQPPAGERYAQQPGYAQPPPPAQSARPLPPPRAGEWVYTQQYGRVWIPYDQDYTYVAPGAATASTYVFYPRFGWRWVASPWVIGVGPVPRWGPRGPVRFAWYAHPWWRGRVVVGRRGWHHRRW